MRDRRRIDLIFDTGCPNVTAARALLRDALSAAGLSAEWREWERGSPETPDEFRALGSPTILVDGIDVTGADPSSDDASSCRIYTDESGGLRGVPQLRTVILALGPHASRREARPAD